MLISRTSLAFLLSTAMGGLQAQTCINVSTGYDQDSDLILEESIPDDDYTITRIGAGTPAEAAVTVPDEWPVAAGVWLLNDERSRWVGFSTFQTTALPGLYAYEILFFLPDELDASKAILVGQWAADDGGVDIVVNEVATGVTAPGFAAWTPIPANTGLGLFTPGFNSIVFQVSNDGEAGVENPSGLRIEACVEVPQPINRPYNISTGFDEGNGNLLEDDALDTTYTLTGPPGSGIQAVEATVVAEDGFPIPPWLPASVNSRWIGLTTDDSTGPSGIYGYVTVVTLPGDPDPGRAALEGAMAADELVEDVLINGISTGLMSNGVATLTPFATGAGQGLFTSGENTVEFLVSNTDTGPTGLRVDGEVVTGPPPPEPSTGILSLDTGFDDASGTTFPNGMDDDGYVVLGPPGSRIGPALASIVNDDAYPVPPWMGSSSISKWIGPQADSNGPAGTYTYVVQVNLPDGFEAALVRLVGGWAVDNAALDITVNGTPTGIPGAAGFAGLTPFPPDAGLGLFLTGDNEIRFVIDNAEPGPTGLRVEAVLGVEEPRPLDLSSGVGNRGEGSLPVGFEDEDFVVLGPAGSGIGPRPSVIVSTDASPWVTNSELSRWVGLDGESTSGPAGTYSYSVEVSLPPHLNPHRVAISGRWAAFPAGTDILLNGTSLQVTAAGPETFTDLPADCGKGLSRSGLNTLVFLVENDAAGPTGLRVEARMEAVPTADPLDISTAFEQFSAEVLGEGSTDDDYTVTTPLLDALPASVVNQPSPAWSLNSPTSGWIGLETLESIGDPGVYTFQIEVTLSADEADEATIVGGWAVDDTGVDVEINGTSTGLTNNSGYASLAMFPADFGRGLFQEGSNSIEFVLSNDGATPTPVGLRIDARVDTAGETPWKPTFHRGDATGDGAVNITDGIYILNFLFLGGPSPGCMEAANSNDDGAVNITDGIHLLNYLFLGGPPPDPPGAEGPCGSDPFSSPSNVGCDDYPAC